MTQQGPLKIGLMGFGLIGRQIYELAALSKDIEIVAIVDLGSPEILHYLLCAEVMEAKNYTLQGNFLINARSRARLMQIESPADVPWDAFGVDAVIDATGKFRDALSMQQHIENGARRVLLRTLPLDTVDRIVIPGINEETIRATDQLVSAGSPTTSALCLLLKNLAESFAIMCCSMTTVHAFTSDQALHDYAGSDFRRSRSAAKNIIPNTHEAALWLGQILPEFEGKVMTWALNVPVQEGCLLDVTLMMQDSNVTVDDINAVMRAAAKVHTGVVDVTEDPIVSSDVIGKTSSLLFDTKGTIKAGDSTIKTLSWYENRGHAARMLDVLRLYAKLDSCENLSQ